MTDKQIIFKCDVDCIRKNTEECFELDCIKGQESILKQLKAKEQECERLKSKNNYSPEVLKQCPHYKNDNVCTYLSYETKCEGDCNYTAFQDFIAEIDQLKFDYAELEKRHNDSFEQFKQLKSENKHLNDLLNQALKDYEKARETLTEIKEIADKIDDGGGCAYGDYDCDNCSSLDQKTVCTYNKVKKILLQKISEVENG